MTLDSLDIGVFPPTSTHDTRHVPPPIILSLKYQCSIWYMSKHYTKNDKYFHVDTVYRWTNKGNYGSECILPVENDMDQFYF